MHERTKAAVADHDVAGQQIGMHVADARQVMSAQRSGEDVQQQAGGCMKQRQDVHLRKAATGLLRAGLAERLLQCRRVRHRTTGTVDQECPMTVPTIVVQSGAAVQTEAQ